MTPLHCTSGVSGLLSSSSTTSPPPSRAAIDYPITNILITSISTLFLFPLSAVGGTAPTLSAVSMLWISQLISRNTDFYFIKIQFLFSPLLFSLVIGLTVTVYLLDLKSAHRPTPISMGVLICATNLALGKTQITTFAGLKELELI